jgi:hypothetical protein
MIMKRRFPNLRRRYPPPRHVFGHAGLPYIDPELEQLAMVPRRSPQRVRDAHGADQPTPRDGLVSASTIGSLHDASASPSLAGRWAQQLDLTSAISWHFGRDRIPYALETDWPVGHVGLEPANIILKNARAWAIATRSTGMGFDKSPAAALALAVMRFVRADEAAN